MLPKIRPKVKKLLPLLQNLYVRTRKGQFSFAYLNVAQFLGVLNDNLYKLLMIFLLLSTLGAGEASNILSAAGALYVIPFLLFSASAGILADRFSKQTLIRTLKGVEVFLMALAFVAFYTKSVWGCYSLLFLIATHSALFGPPKYGILPELVDKSEMSKANGHLTAFTYLAMIIGTFLASFLTDFMGKNFVFVVLFCFVFSLAGFFASFGIKKTPSQKSTKKMNLLFIREIYYTIVECKKTPLLAPCLFGSAFFLFIGAFTQLNIIPLAIESLHLSEYAGGYLFLFTAIGIALGSFISGKFFKNKLDISTSCIAGFSIAIDFFCIWAFSSFLVPTIIFLTLLGIFGGVFVVSFDTFIQINSPLGKRGQTIAAANFLSFFGVLIASLCLYLFGHLMGLSAAVGFFFMGLITLVATGFLSFQLLEVFLPFLSRRLFKGRGLAIIDPLKTVESSKIFFCEEFSFSLFWTASIQSPRSRFLILAPKKGFLFRLLSLSPSVYFLEQEAPLQTIIAKATSLEDDETSVCIFLNEPLPERKNKRTFSFLPFKESKSCILKTHQEESGNAAVVVEKSDVI